ncbi:LOW QUALITY PROTEIN: hypothetical protein PanWU01x14_271080, partial [Parasponia andersonii]
MVLKTLACLEAINLGRWWVCKEIKNVGVEEGESRAHQLRSLVSGSAKEFGEILFRRKEILIRLHYGPPQSARVVVR